MQTILTYRSQQELLEFSFLKGSLKIICPDSNTRDDLALRLSKKRQDQIQVLTWWDFLNRLRKDITQDLKISKKNELWLELAMAWRKKYKNLSENIFFQAFPLVFELREFSLDPSLFDEIFSLYPKDVGESVKFLFAYMEARGICDVSRVCHEITKSVAYRKEKSKSSLLFLGFSHLSAIKIDLVKELCRTTDVYLAVPDSIFKKAKGFDWIKWVQMPDHKLIELKKNVILKNLHCALFPKNKMANVYFSLAGKEKVDQVFLGRENPSFSELNEIPAQGLFFKAFSELLFPVEKDLSLYFQDALFRYQEREIYAHHFLEKIENQIKINLSQKNFRRLKVLMEYKKALLSWAEFSSLHSSFSPFDFQIIEMVVNQNLPKIYNRPLLLENPLGTLKGLEGLWGIDKNKRGFLCVTHSHLLPLESSEDAQLNSLLASIGPLKKRTFELEHLKAQILEFLSFENSTLLMEEGLSEQSYFWSDIQEAFEKKVSLHLESSPLKVQLDPLREFTSLEIKKENFGPLAIQNYMDCPRKFYFSNIDPISQGKIHPEDLSPLELGRIEHEVIEAFFSRCKGEKFSFDRHKQICGEFIKKFCEKKSLTEVEYKSSFLEVENFTRRAILELKKIESIDKDVHYQFEVEKKRGELQGRIDCIVSIPSLGIGVLDFKRSKSSIPTISDFKEMKEIQIWFYLNLFPPEQLESSFFGYINLSSIQDSLLFCSNEDVEMMLKSSCFLHPLKFNILKFDLSIELERFNENLEKSLESLEREKDFFPVPRSKFVCEYCPVSLVCPRGLPC